MRRNSLLLLLLIMSLVVIAALGGWLIGSNITSPAEAAARTAPPTPSPILVPVEERVLTSDIVTRGTARFGLPQAISIVPSSLKSEVGRITSLPTDVSQLYEGDVLMTISGRPVFVLQGDLPVFRDLVPGRFGDDVRQLEECLRRMGFDPGAVDNVYDEETSVAVAAWYMTGGWDAFGPTDEQSTLIKSLEYQLAEAIHRQILSEEAHFVASLAVEVARANADSAELLATADVVAKTTALDGILANTYIPSQDRAIANANLDAALAVQAAMELQVEQAVQEAIYARDTAEREVKIANDLASQIRFDLDAARSETGEMVPADEIIFVPDLPVRVDELNAMIGDVIDGPVMIVTNNQLAIDSVLSLDEASLVNPGMEALIDEPNLGITATGVVSRVADTPGTFGADGFHIYFEVLVNSTPHTLEGFSLRLTIPVQTTGDAVTVVPVSALSLGADGTSRIQIENNGQLEMVVVEPGLAADGYIAVAPLVGELLPGQSVVIGFESEI